MRALGISVGVADPQIVECDGMEAASDADMAHRVTRILNLEDTNSADEA
jgi:hypothetical protein